MKKKRLQKSSCFLMGLIGAAVGTLAGILMLLKVGEAALFSTVSLVMIGAMLLFLALAEQGPLQKAKRAKLLVLFFLVVLAYPNLPLLSPLAEALVMPLAGILYWRRTQDFPAWVILLLSEIGYAACKTLALWEGWQTHSLLLNGAGLVFVSLTRFFLLLRFFQRQKKEENPAI